MNAYDLEQYVDTVGLQRTLEALASICGMKSQHVADTWQDAPLANAWRRAANAIDRCADGQPVQRVTDAQCIPNQHSRSTRGTLTIPEERAGLSRLLMAIIRTRLDASTQARARRARVGLGDEHA